MSIVCVLMKSDGNLFKVDSFSYRIVSHLVANSPKVNFTPLRLRLHKGNFHSFKLLSNHFKNTKREKNNNKSENHKNYRLKL